MANCKDCLGFEFCLDRLGTTKYYDNVIAANNVEELCQKFKDRNRFVELPCNIGNTLYMLNRNKSNIQEMTLDKPDIRCHCVKDDEFACCMPICNDKENGICAYRFRFDFSEIGKTVFLTREEAERALKER